MPSIRVYPYNSGLVAVRWRIDGPTASWGVTGGILESAPTLRAFVEFNTTVHGSGLLTRYGPSATRAIRFFFDYERIPELSKKKATRENPIFVYIRSAKAYTLPGGYMPAFEWGFASPFLDAKYEYEVSGDIFHFLKDNGPRYYSASELRNSYPNQITDPYFMIGGRSSPYETRRYAFGGEVLFDGHTGEFPPYREVSYEEIIPYAKNLKTGGNDASKPIRFQWTFAYDIEDGYILIGTLSQKTARVRWRAVGENEYAEYQINGTADTYTVPANTFNASEIEWQVLVASDDGISAKEPGWTRVSLVNPVITPTDLYPKGQIINGAVGNLFSWQTPHIADNQQDGFDARYSADNGVLWKALWTADTSRKNFTLKADTLESGAYRWRVRCKNRAGVWGPWSDPAVFLVQTGLAPPVVRSVTGKPRPLVTWTSAGQTAFQLTILDPAGKTLYDTDTVYGEGRQRQTSAYLPPGEIRARVRIANIFGFWSGWGEKKAVIENIGGEPIVLKSRKVQNGAELSWETAGAYIKYHVYRDNVQIASVAGTAFTDWMTNGKRRYFVRGITREDFYTDSPEVVELTLVKGAALAPVDALGPEGWFLMNRKVGSEPSVSCTWEQKVNFVHYDGRAKCVAEVSEFEDAQHDFSFTLTREEAAAFEKLCGRTVVFKDCFGALAVGYLGRRTVSRRPITGWADVSFTVTETDFKEGGGDD